METKHVTVPRMLVKCHEQHSEPYGESIVELNNGMVTDVYTDEDGTLYTITNDEALTEYLQAYMDETVHIEKGDLTIRTATVRDAPLLKTWINDTGNWLQSRQNYTDETVRLFISHAITESSHLLVIEHNEKPIGTISYECHDDTLILDIRLFRKASVSPDELKQGIDVLIDNAKNRLGFNIVLSNVLEEDVYHVSLLEQLDFKLLPKMSFDTPVSKDIFKKTFVFQYPFLGS